MSGPKPHTTFSRSNRPTMPLRVSACTTALASLLVSVSSLGAPLSLVIATERTESAADCASEAKLFAKVERISQRPLQPESLNGDAVRVVIRFDRSQDEYRAELGFQGPKPGERSFRDRSNHCEPLEDAVVVAIALLLDREVERRERESGEVTRAVSTINIVQSKIELTRLRTRSFHATGEVQTVFDSSLVPMFTFALGLERPRGWLFESSAILMPPATRAFEAGSVSVSLVAGGLRLCKLWGNEWQLGPCSSVALGRLRGSGHGFDESLSSNLVWAAFGGEWLLQRSLSERWNLGLHAAVWVPTKEQRFSVHALGTAWNSSAIWPWLGFRLGVRF